MLDDLFGFFGGTQFDDSGIGGLSNTYTGGDWGDTTGGGSGYYSYGGYSGTDDWYSSTTTDDWYSDDSTDDWYSSTTSDDSTDDGWIYLDAPGGSSDDAYYSEGWYQEGDLWQGSYEGEYYTSYEDWLAGEDSWSQWGDDSYYPTDDTDDDYYSYDSDDGY